MADFVYSYVKGCVVCQLNKLNTHSNKPPVFPISIEANTLPFQTVMIDWITKLPPSDGFDLILTVTDYDCSKAMVFIPCNEASSAEKMMKLYLKNVAVHFRIPQKLVSDCDPCLTSEFFKALCDLYDIQRNTSTAYYP